jgi:hypothetical protein
MKLKVYLAAQYARRDELRGYRTILEAEGIEVTSNWLDETSPLNGTMDKHSEEFLIHTATTDLQDIDRANAIIFFSEDPKVGIPRGGRHVEFGYALAKNKGISVIGPKENVFHHIAGHHFNNLDEFLATYRELKPEIDKYTGVYGGIY